MCLPNFEKFIQVDEPNALTGYRNWRLPIKEPTILLSEHMSYKWNRIIEGPHEVLDRDSGIYAYNYYNNYNNNYYNNYYYNYYIYYNNYYNNYNNNYNNYYYYNYYYNNNNNHYYLAGIIKQYGKTAIHKTGQRSEFTKIDFLFTIRESDAKGPQEFLDWIKKFNSIIQALAVKYECKTIHWQDFDESQKR